MGYFIAFRKKQGEPLMAHEHHSDDILRKYKEYKKKYVDVKLLKAITPDELK